MSSQRQLNLLRAPVIASYGTNETPEFQRQNRDFTAAVKAAGKAIELVEGTSYITTISTTDVETVRITAKTCGVLVCPGDGAAHLLSPRSVIEQGRCLLRCRSRAEV